MDLMVMVAAYEGIKSGADLPEKVFHAISIVGYTITDGFVCEGDAVE
jgi:hypothetical protein